MVAPVASPAGGEYAAGTSVELTTATEGATIYYSTDGSEATRSSAEYTAPIEITEAMTIKAIAVKDGMTDSEVMEEHYTILLPEQVVAPVASPAGGAVASGTTVELTTETSGATIYYSTDGSEATRSSSEYTEPIEITEAMTIKAIAVKDGMSDSEMLEEHYTVLPPEQVVAPVADPEGGAVTSGTTVELTTATSGATIYYTTDGSKPTRASAEYTAPIEITEAMTIKAIAVKDGMSDSEVMEEHYTITTRPGPANLTASAGDRSVTLKWSDATETGTVTYAVYQVEGPSAPADPVNWTLVQSNIPGNSYTVTELTNGKTYAFAVKANYADGASDFSNVTTATPRAAEGNGGSGGVRGGLVLSDNTHLANLQIWGNDKKLTLSPAFAPNTTEYTGQTEAEQIEITAKPAYFAAKVMLQDEVITDRTKVQLEDGANILILTVQAENGSKKEYTLTIHRDTPKLSESEIHFMDIAGHWAESEIKRAAAKGIVSGYPDGSFKPNNPVTRTEFTVMLAGALKMDGEGSSLTFADHEQIGGWAKPTIAQVVNAGIVNGYEDGSFRPNGQITRAEMATMIARALKLHLNTYASTGFADDATIPQWAKGAIDAIHTLGIVDGRSWDRFVPNETATRAEATVMLLRMLEKKGD